VDISQARETARRRCKPSYICRHKRTPANQPCHELDDGDDDEDDGCPLAYASECTHACELLSLVRCVHQTSPAYDSMMPLLCISPFSRDNANSHPLPSANTPSGLLPRPLAPPLPPALALPETPLPSWPLGLLASCPHSDLHSLPLLIRFLALLTVLGAFCIIPRHSTPESSTSPLVPRLAA
jgi:hypothetical protein